MKISRQNSFSIATPSKDGTHARCKLLILLIAFRDGGRGVDTGLRRYGEKFGFFSVSADCIAFNRLASPRFDADARLRN